MPAQPQPVPLPLEGGVDEKADQAVVNRPQRIVNARYARTGALSKRNGYQVVEEYGNLGEDYVAFDGDKFFAKKNDRLGVEFHQRRDRDEFFEEAYNFKIGETGRMHPALTALPGQRGPAAKDALLCDVAYSTGTDRIGPVVLYVRLEMVQSDQAGIISYDIIVDYIDPNDDRLVQRAPTRIRNAVAYHEGTHQQINAVVTLTTPSRLWIVYSGESSLVTKGIYARSLDWGNDPTGDVVGAEMTVVTSGSTPPYQGDATSGGFDVAATLSGYFGVFYVSTPAVGTAWARVTSGLVEAYPIHRDPAADRVTSVAIATNDFEHVFSYTSVSAAGDSSRGYAGRFNAAASTGTGVLAISAVQLYNANPAYYVGAHTSTASVMGYVDGGTTFVKYFAGINCGFGFRWCTGTGGVATLDPGINTIACAWAIGRPSPLADPETALFARVVVPMVSWGGELGGGAGLLADVTPVAGVVQDGAKLLATYAIDQVSLSTVTITTQYVVAGQPVSHAAPENGDLAIYPTRGSSRGPATDPRWLIATGQPAAPVMLSIQVPPVDDFEFIEPGVMLMGPGVPVLCDALQGVSELGFHTSPAVIHSGGFNANPGFGYAAGSIVQYRFQYRVIDGLGRPQVSPASEPYQMTAPLADTTWQFHLAPLDVTVRTHSVMIDVFRTDDKTADFCWIATLTSSGGAALVLFHDKGPKVYPRDENVAPNVENYFMTPPCALVALRGSFRHVLVTRENELWPSKRRVATTAPQFDIVDAAGWDSQEPVVCGGEIDGKLILFSRSRIAYTYEMNGGLAPFTDIPSDTGALPGSRAVSTHLGVFYQAATGIRLIGRDIAIHEVGQMVGASLGLQRVRGGIRVPAMGEVRLRLSDGFTYLVFDYLNGSPDKPCWYVYRYESDPAYLARVDEKLAPDGRLLFLCTGGTVLYETIGRYVDGLAFVQMRVLSPPLRGGTPMSYLATIEGAVNLELPFLAVPLAVRLTLIADYFDSRPTPVLVAKEWTTTEIEAFDRRQLQVSSSENVCNAPAVALLYEDVLPVDVEAGPLEGFGYRLSAMAIVSAPRDQKSLFPVSNGARK